MNLYVIDIFQCYVPVDCNCKCISGQMREVRGIIVNSADAAVDLLLEGKTDRVVAYKNGEYVDYDIDEALSMTKTLPEYQWEIARALSYNYTK